MKNYILIFFFSIFLFLGCATQKYFPIQNLDDGLYRISVDSVSVTKAQKVAISQASEYCANKKGKMKTVKDRITRVYGGNLYELVFSCEKKGYQYDKNLIKI